MNWLAHLLLSEPDPEFRLGNVLADFLPPPVLDALPAGFRRGVDCHRRIDRFTDTHPLVRRSWRRLDGCPQRRFAPALVDVFYDHVLAREWEQHGAGAFTDFTAGVYRDVFALAPQVPSPARERLVQMSAEDWLGSYRELGGIRHALARMDLRLRRPADLAGAAGELEAQYAGFRADFDGFFPELRAHVLNGPAASVPAMPRP